MRVLRHVPHGRSLPPATWAQRHRWVGRVLAVQTALLPAYAVVRGEGLRAAGLAVALPAALWLLSRVRRLPPALRGTLAAVGLMAVSSAVVRLSGGSTEAHFAYFVMVPVVALYESWLPFGAAVGFVLLEHGLMGESGIVDGMPVQHPWLHAVVHAAFFAAACVGSVVGWRLHELARDNEHRLLEDLAAQAERDDLTGLPNRAGFRRRLAEALAAAPGAPLTVLVVDLDQFKQVNDTLGPAWGDALLALVGPRLGTVLREGDLLARLGGDEFGVLLPGRPAAAGQVVADRLRAALDASFDLDGLALDVDASAGLAGSDGSAAPDPVAAADELMRRADLAMYAAKAAGTGTTTYAPELDADRRDRLAVLSELRRGLEDDQLVLHFQPKLDLTTGRVTGAEALVRWQHPVRGLLMPGHFIPTVETTSLIVGLTDRVLDLATRAARDLRDRGHEVQVAVNVTPRCLLDPALPARVAALLAAHGVAASALRIEITETSLMHDPESALANLWALAELGVGLSVDDFGTGYSSLAYLRRLPVDELKVDRTFVAGMTTSASDAVIVRSAVDLGHNLGMTVVAEGVEDAATLSALGDVRCDLAQGYHVARPMAPAALQDWLDARVTAASAG